MDNFSARGYRKTEAKFSALEADIRALAKPKSRTTGSLQSPFLYMRMMARAVREALVEQKGWTDEASSRGRDRRDPQPSGHQASTGAEDQSVEEDPGNGCDFRECPSEESDGRPTTTRKSSAPIHEPNGAVRGCHRTGNQVGVLSAESRLHRHNNLLKYDVLIQPKPI